MRLDLIDNYSDEEIMRYDIIIKQHIDMNTRSMGKLLNSAANDNFNYAEYLNKINNQGIMYLDINNWYYEINNKKLNFSYLSTSERIFLAARISDRHNIKLMIYGAIMQLDKRNMKRFINEYKNSNSIDLAFVCEEDKEVLGWITGMK